MIKFDDVEDLVSASECVGSDDNIAYDCVNYYCELPVNSVLFTCSCKARGCVLAVCPCAYHSCQILRDKLCLPCIVLSYAFHRPVACCNVLIQVCVESFRTIMSSCMYSYCYI